MRSVNSQARPLIKVSAVIEEESDDDVAPLSIFGPSLTPNRPSRIGSSRSGSSRVKTAKRVCHSQSLLNPMFDVTFGRH